MNLPKKIVMAEDIVIGIVHIIFPLKDRVVVHINAKTNKA